MGKNWRNHDAMTQQVFDAPETGGGLYCIWGWTVERQQGVVFPVVTHWARSYKNLSRRYSRTITNVTVLLQSLMVLLQSRQIFIVSGSARCAFRLTNVGILPLPPTYSVPHFPSHLSSPYPFPPNHTSSPPRPSPSYLLMQWICIHYSKGLHSLSLSFSLSLSLSLSLSCFHLCYVPFGPTSLMFPTSWNFSISGKVICFDSLISTFSPLKFQIYRWLNYQTIELENELCW